MWVDGLANQQRDKRQREWTWTGCLLQMKTFVSPSIVNFSETKYIVFQMLLALKKQNESKTHVFKWSLKDELRYVNLPKSIFSVYQRVCMEALVSQSNINQILSHAHNFGIREFWLQKPWSWQDSCSNSHKSIFMCVSAEHQAFIFSTTHSLCCWWSEKSNLKGWV